MPPSPERFWKSARHLHAARRKALRFAEANWLARQNAKKAAAKVAAAQTDAPEQAFSLHHSGEAHRAFFHQQLKPLIARLPRQFQALEIGAGMGMLSALLAAHSAGRVLATEMYWSNDSPTAFQHAGTYAHLLTVEETLRRVLKVESNAEHLPLKTAFNPKRMNLAIASAHDLPARSNRFDLVFSLNCLEHIPSVSAYTKEAHRVLKPGGRFFNSTMPLYASAYGHHCQEFYPLPWGHLLWEPEEFAQLILKGSRGRVEWIPGVPLTQEHILTQILPTLNAYTPKDFRRSLRSCPWKVEGFVEHQTPSDAQLAQELGLTNALRGLTPEDLLIHGYTFLLRKTTGPTWNPALNLSSTIRKRFRSLTRFLYDKH